MSSILHEFRALLGDMLLRLESEISVSQEEQMKTNISTLYRLASKRTTADIVCSSISSYEKRDYLRKAVRLHNLSFQINDKKCNVLLKASCAWIFALMGEQTFQNFVTILNILSKCSNRFAEMNESQLCNECLEAAITLWENSVDLRACAQDPAIEFSDNISAISKCLLQKLRLVASCELQNSIAELKRIISIAMEIFGLVDFRLQIVLLDEIFNIGIKYLTSKDNEGDPIYIFSSIIALLAAKKSQRHNVTNPSTDQISFASFYVFEIKAYLSLAFSYCEYGEPSKVISCIEAIENSEVKRAISPHSNLLDLSIFYARFVLSIKCEDFGRTDKYLSELVNIQSIPLSKALELAWLLTDAKLSLEEMALKIQTFCNQLVARFPSDAEVMAIKVFNLQFLFRLSEQDECKWHLEIFIVTLLKDECTGAVIEQYALDIAETLICKDAQTIHPLEKSVGEELHRVLFSYVLHYERKQKWKTVRLWCDILIQLCSVQEIDENIVIDCLIVKARALIHLSLVEDAIKFIKLAAEKRTDRRVLIELFVTCAHSEKMCFSDVIDDMNQYLRRLTKTFDIKSFKGKYIQETLHWKHFLNDCHTLSQSKKGIYLLHLTKSMLESFIDLVHKIPDSEVPSCLQSFDLTWKVLLELSCEFVFYFIEEKCCTVLHSTISVTEDNIDVVSICEAMMKQSMSKFMDFVTTSLKVMLSVIERISLITGTSFVETCGDDDSIKWLASAMSIVASAIVKAEKSIKLSGKELTNDENAILKTAVMKAYSVADRFYSLVHKNIDNLLQQCRCLLCAASSCVDMALQEKSQVFFESLSGFLVQGEHLDEAQQFCEKLKRISHDFLHIQEVCSYHSRALFLQVICFGLSHQHEALLKFIHDDLTEADVTTLIDLSYYISSGCGEYPVEVQRALIKFTIAKCINSHNRSHCYAFYRKLMEISSSRRTALETLIEFEEFLATSRNLRTIDECCEHEIESVIALAYSYAISLQDQDQLMLAELFLTKLMQLSEFSPKRQLEWQAKVKEASEQMTRMKATARKNTIFFSTHDVIGNPSNITALNLPLGTNKAATTEDIGKIGYVSAELFH